MSNKTSKLSESGESTHLRENVTLDAVQGEEMKKMDEKTIDKAILERLEHRQKGPLALSPSEVKDTEFVHFWANSDVPGRIQGFLDIGASIVQYTDWEGKTLNHTAQRGHTGKMIHMKIPKHIDAKRREIERIQHWKDQKMYKEDKDGNPVTFEKKVVYGIPNESKF